MKLSELKKILTGLEDLKFQLPDGSLVPEHFHITEVGQIYKKFIDCGGTVRREQSISLQLWYASDYDHRLKAQKLLDIIKLSEQELKIGDFEIEVEYQAESISKYGLEFSENHFVLTSKQTDCLAKDKCGIEEDWELKPISNQGCQPGSGCC